MFVQKSDKTTHGIWDVIWNCHDCDSAILDTAQYKVAMVASGSHAEDQL